MAFRKPSRQSFFSSRVSPFSPGDRYFHKMSKKMIKQVSHRIKDEWNRQYCEKCIVIDEQSHKIVHEIVQEYVAMRETIKPAIHLSSNWRERDKMLAKREKWEVYRWHFVNHLANHFSYLASCHSRQTIGIFTKCQKPAIHLSSNWRECEKMLAKWEKREVYRWHFVNLLPIIFTRLRSRRVVMCLVVVYVRSFVLSLIQLLVCNIFWPNLKYGKKKVLRRF